MTPFISFIVPVFNVEEFLPQCLDSIFSQDLKDDDFEVICVEDCSLDDSLGILELYQRKYDNLYVVRHAQNRGLSAARNTGLSIARGEYVWFIDSDDFLSNKSLNESVSRLRKTSPDVLLFNYQDYSESEGFISHHVFENSSTMDGVSFVNRYFKDSFVYHLGYVWRMMIRRSFLKEIALSFPENEFWEDTVYFPKCILSAGIVLSVDTAHYCYRRNTNSISAGRSGLLSGKKVYDYCFRAGGGLYDYSLDLAQVDKGIAESIRGFAIDHYFNSLSIKLMQTYSGAILSYVDIIRENKIYAKKYLPYFHGLSWLCASSPYCGAFAVYAFKPMYKCYCALKKFFL